MTAPRGSVLTMTYWAILPFHLGSEIVKYRLDPEAPPENVADDATDYLKTDMVNRLAERDYRFTLAVQRRTDSDRIPLDTALADWPQDESPIVQVATLSFPPQDVAARVRSVTGQYTPFNHPRYPTH